MATNIVYNPDSEIQEKAAQNASMPGKDKYDIQTKINHGLKLDDHVEIFKILVRSGAKYTTNTSGTYFDLNDLENTTLWKIKQYLNLTLEKLAREKIIEKAEQDKKIAELQLSNKMAKERKELIKDGTITNQPVAVSVPRTHYTPDNVPGYDDLRTQALYGSVANTQNESVRSHNMQAMQPPTNFGTVFRSDFGGNFVSGGVCITDEDLETETEIEPTDNGTELTLPDDDLDDGLEDNDLEDNDLEDDDLEEDNESIYDDPSQMIRNGGQDAHIEPGFDDYDEEDDEENED